MRHISNQKGLTLLEVMLAVAILAIALVSLLGTQTQSISFLSDSRFSTVAAMLIQEKMIDVSLLPFDDVYDDSGDFASEFNSYHWSIEVDNLTESDTGLAGVDDRLKAVTITVSLTENSTLSLSAQIILFKNIVDT